MAREAQAAPAHDHTGPDHTTKSLGSLGKEGEGDGGGAAHRLDGGLLLALGGEVRGVDVAWWRGGWGWGSGRGEGEGEGEGELEGSASASASGDQGEG